ncbi:hypothetical protein GCM10023155_37680 [Bremerella cremea]
MRMLIKEGPHYEPKRFSKAIVCQISREIFPDFYSWVTIEGIAAQVGSAKDFKSEFHPYTVPGFSVGKGSQKVFGKSH